jgi:transposase-like protein
MSKLSAEAKQAIIDKVLAKDGRTVREIAEAHNIVRRLINSVRLPIILSFLLVL